jgi:hypothetical protein
LRALSAEDLTVLSALLQDAVVDTGDIAWARRRRRFALLVNRFRWEDAAAAERQGRPFERVRALLSIEGVLAARASGVDPTDRSLIISLLALAFDPGEDGAGRLRLILAGNGEIALEVEALDVTLADVTRPYEAPSRHRPAHAEE